MEGTHGPTALYFIRGLGVPRTHRGQLNWKAGRRRVAGPDDRAPDDRAPADTQPGESTRTNPNVFTRHREARAHWWHTPSRSSCTDWRHTPPRSSCTQIGGTRQRDARAQIGPKSVCNTEGRGRCWRCCQSGPVSDAMLWAYGPKNHSPKPPPKAWPWGEVCGSVCT